VDALLHGGDGRPNHAIFYIAHLSDAERMFFVTLLLEQLLTWTRRQSGTTSLRALVYMDEIFGYFPPVENPPSKKPLLALLKQARAFGVGVVLATQNPVDLDYKGLTNAGTWFIGKLQAERDKLRVLEGLALASAEAGGAASRQDLDRLISQLGARTFLMHNVHEDAPVVFQTRWAMSYLCGPLTRTQVRDLMAQETPDAAADPISGSVPPEPSAQPVGAQPSAGAGARPVLPPEVRQVFLPATGSGAPVAYQPQLLAMGRVRFVDRKRKVDVTHPVQLLIQAPPAGGAVDWQAGTAVDLALQDLLGKPAGGARFHDVPATINAGSKLKRMEKNFAAP